MRRTIFVIYAALLLSMFGTLAQAQTQTQAQTGASAPASAPAPSFIRLATTTSTDNSGLLKFLLPTFEKKYGIKVQVISVGSGKAIKLGENGDVDVILVHSRPDEDRFVQERHGLNRRDVMYNDFVMVGPKSDPARIGQTHEVKAAMKKIAEKAAPFVSRGDDSGTEKLELRLWSEIGITPKSGKDSWYFSAGSGMGEVLMLSNSKQAYTLSDRATYAAFQNKIDLAIMVEGDTKLFNPYGVIAVNPAKSANINYQGAIRFIEWLTSAEGQKRIADFRVTGVQMFFPSAIAVTDAVK